MLRPAYPQAPIAGNVPPGFKPIGKVGANGSIIPLSLPGVGNVGQPVADTMVPPPVQSLTAQETTPGLRGVAPTFSGTPTQQPSGPMLATPPAMAVPDAPAAPTAPQTPPSAPPPGFRPIGRLEAPVRGEATPYPDMPTLRAAPRFDPDKRGMERTALIGAGAGLLLGGVRGALTGGIAGAQGFDKGNQAQYKTESAQVTAGNKTALDAYDRGVKAADAQNKFTESQYKNDLTGYTSEQKTIQAADAAQKRFESAMAGIRQRGDAASKTLEANVKRWESLDQAARQKTLLDLSKHIDEDGALWDEAQQADRVTFYNELATQAGLPPRIVPGSVIGQDASGRPIKAPLLSMSPKVLNARSGERTSQANAALAGVRATEVPKQTAIAQQNANTQAGRLSLDFQKYDETVSHNAAMEDIQGRTLALKEKAAAIKAAAPEDVANLTPTQKRNMEEELRTAPSAIATIRAKAGAKPERKTGESAAAYQTRLQPWIEKRNALESAARGQRAVFDETAKQFGMVPSKSNPGTYEYPQVTPPSGPISYDPDAPRGKTAGTGSLAPAPVNLAKPVVKLPSNKTTGTVKTKSGNTYTWKPVG